MPRACRLPLLSSPPPLLPCFAGDRICALLRSLVLHKRFVVGVIATLVMVAKAVATATATKIVSEGEYRNITAWLVIFAIAIAIAFAKAGADRLLRPDEAP